jgi:hypothetical protein
MKRLLIGGIAALAIGLTGCSMDRFVGVPFRDGDDVSGWHWSLHHQH